MTTYPLATLAPTISDSGISIPDYNDTLETIRAWFREIYGPDIYIEDDSQDGQFIGILAKVIFDINNIAVQTFQGFSPDFAQGLNLSTLVKINGIQKQDASKSTVVGTVVGVVGTIITGGIVSDNSGNKWDLSTPITIPVSGQIDVTATAQNDGAISANIGEVNKIVNPQLGWQSFVNTSEAVTGQPVEADYQLRQRQTISTALPSLTVLASIEGGVANVSGVTRSKIYENDTDITDSNGIPAHTIAAVVHGGDAQDVCDAIGLRKAPGIQTFGSVSRYVYDSLGLPTVVKYEPMSEVEIFFAITIKALFGYSASTGLEILQAVIDYVNSLEIGEDVYLSQVQAAASLIGQTIGQTFYISDFRLGFAVSPTGTSNLTINYAEAARCQQLNINLSVI